jgi:predicted DNA-binding protein (MmcQ/YjbR family)
LCLALPESREVASWGHPNFRAGKRTFVAFEVIKGRPSMAFRLNPTDVDLLLRRKQFFPTPMARGNGSACGRMAEWIGARSRNWSDRVTGW